MARIFHIGEARLWRLAKVGGEYRQSTLGKTLEDEGFIHCSYLDQVERVANAVFVGHEGLVLLVIDSAKVGPVIRDENLEGGTDLFPHIYGPLNVDAVVDVLPFPADQDGRFHLPKGI